ncbi:MAG TPA: NAD-dependent epimerase [Acidimicrobiales bacterium]|nr:NAD-dependent epimerase [Acidimicrobiales bacterium]
MKVLVTGAAGFIGYHVSERLLARGDAVIGLDVVNDYYDPTLKDARVARLHERTGFEFIRGDMTDPAVVDDAFGRGVDRVVHLAAQAGVRYSITNPDAYLQSNLVGFLRILEGCRRAEVEHLVYASSSSVYGANTTLPFSTSHHVDHPISLYAATKKANELIAHSYSHLYGLPTTGLRFFTAYGPWGRPDMALFLFTRAILEGRPLPVFNEGRMQRDFTYIDDIAEGVVRTLDHTATGDPAWSSDDPDPARSRAPYRVYNIGNNSPVQLLDYIRAIEDALGMTAELELLPMQPGDVPASAAEISDLMEDVGFAPSTPVTVGVRRFVEWYREYYGPGLP